MEICIVNYVDKSTLETLETKLLLDNETRDVYAAHKSAIELYIENENDYSLKDRVKTLKEIKLPNDKLDRIYEKYGHTEESADIDGLIRYTIGDVFDELIQDAKKAAFEEVDKKIVDELLSDIKEKASCRRSMSIREIFYGFRHNFYKAGYLKDVYDGMLCKVNYNLLGKHEYRDMRVLIRRKTPMSKKVDVIAMYDVKRDAGDIVQGMTFLEDVYENEIKKVVPNPSKHYGKPRWLTKGDITFFATVAASYAITSVFPGIEGMLHDGGPIRFLGYTLNAVGIAPVALEKVGAIYVLKKIIGRRTRGYMNKRTLNTITRGYDIDNFGLLANKVTKQQSIRAHLCYATIWLYHDVDKNTLYERLKRYNIEKDEIDDFLDIFENHIRIVEIENDKYTPNKMLIDIPISKISKIGVSEKVKVISNRVDSLENDYPLSI